jgi:hypothetical protein
MVRIPKQLTPDEAIHSLEDTARWGASQGPLLHLSFHPMKSKRLATLKNSIYFSA